MLRPKNRRTARTAACVLLLLRPLADHTGEAGGPAPTSSRRPAEWIDLSSETLETHVVAPRHPPANGGTTGSETQEVIEHGSTGPDWLPLVEVTPRFADGAQTPDTPFGDLIFESARRHGLNPELVAAVARAESVFDPEAESTCGARGLMQLMPATAERFGLLGEEILEPAGNVEAGVRYLRWLADRFDDEVHLMLAAYNAGEGTVERYGGIPPYRETRSYLRRIYADLADP